jgi:hypothetical protein
MLRRPVFGLGPRQWAGWAQSEYGWPSAKEVHNTWLQAGAELGFPGVIALGAFFLIPIAYLLPLARGGLAEATPGGANFARMVVCGLGGYLIASQFITVYGIEAPYHLTVLGAALLKLEVDRQTSHPSARGQRTPCPCGTVDLQSWSLGHEGRSESRTTTRANSCCRGWRSAGSNSRSARSEEGLTGCVVLPASRMGNAAIARAGSLA